MGNSSNQDQGRTYSSQDAVSESFERTRCFAQEHGGAPQLSTPSPVGRRSSWFARQVGFLETQNPQSQSRKRRGIPTGKDGRPVPRSLEMTSIGQVWMKEVTHRGWSQHLAAAHLALHWEDIVGTHVASHSAVSQVENHIATITCESDPWATNLRYFQSQILKNIADQYGDNIIRELRIYGPSHKSSKAGRPHR